MSRTGPGYLPARLAQVAVGSHVSQGLALLPSREPFLDEQHNPGFQPVADRDALKDRPINGCKVIDQREGLGVSDAVVVDTIAVLGEIWVR